jgi:hypothetical protein
MQALGTPEENGSGRFMQGSFLNYFGCDRYLSKPYL